VPSRSWSCFDRPDGEEIGITGESGRQLTGDA
jgi:hypothetical protein